MFFIYFKTTRVFSIIEDAFVIDNDIRFFFEFDCDIFFELNSCSFRVFDDEKRVECKKN
jgi:hypothetical protein